MKQKIDISFQNEYYDKKDLNGKVIVSDAKKITSYFLSDSEVYTKSVLNGFDFSKLSFDLVFTDDEHIHEINREYRDKDKPTDVITFALFADSEPKFVLDGEIFLGEIYISIDTIKKQASEIGNSFKDELYYIISHGILHLFGFDHQDEEGYIFMTGKQKDSLKELYD